MQKCLVGFQKFGIVKNEKAEDQVDDQIIGRIERDECYILARCGLKYDERRPDYKVNQNERWKVKRFGEMFTDFSLISQHSSIVCAKVTYLSGQTL